MILKVLNRGNRTITDVCDKEGVSRVSVSSWIKNSGKMIGMSQKVKKWSPEAKLEAVLKTSKMEESELGIYLRQEGLHSHQLTEWRTEALEALASSSAKPQRHRKDERDQRIVQLEREILRKDRALAEASALLILQKKVHLIWERSEEEKK